MEKLSDKVKQYMRENMSTSALKKKKKKKEKKKETEEQPSSSKASSMFDKFDRPRPTAHKKAAAVPGEVEDQPPSASQEGN